MNIVTHSARAQTGLYRSFTHSPPPPGYDATQAQYLTPLPSAFRWYPSTPLSRERHCGSK